MRRLAINLVVTLAVLLELMLAAFLLAPRGHSRRYREAEGRYQRGPTEANLNALQAVERRDNEFMEQVNHQTVVLMAGIALGGAGAWYALRRADAD